MNIIRQNIPNSITCVNVAAGFLSIVTAFQGNQLICGMPAYQLAYIFIAIAAVADFLDGFAARMLKAYSNLGKELDSLCDLVSFGVAPAVLLYNSLASLPEGNWLKWISVLIPVAGALRLAKFNIDTRQTTSFIGLPIPANAIFWIGYTASVWAGNMMASAWYVALPVTIIVSYLMLSPLPLLSLKVKTLAWQSNKRLYILLAASAVCIFCMGIPGLAWAITLYALSGLLKK